MKTVSKILHYFKKIIRKKQECGDRAETPSEALKKLNMTNIKNFPRIKAI